MVDVLKKEVKDLVGKKDAMEREIKELQDLLDSVNVKLQSSLTSDAF